jgi:hypothetical protein
LESISAKPLILFVELAVVLDNVGPNLELAELLQLADLKSFLASDGRQRQLGFAGRGGQLFHRNLQKGVTKPFVNGSIICPLISYIMASSGATPVMNYTLFLIHLQACTLPSHSGEPADSDHRKRHFLGLEMKLAQGSRAGQQCIV